MFEQDRMIGRLQRRVSEDADVFACFLAGSFGRRASDDYSDLDVALIFTDVQKREEGWLRRRQFAQSIMPYISIKSFDAVHVRPYFHVVLFANGSKVDLRFEDRQTLQPNPWDSQLRILKDTADWAENYQARCRQLPLPQATIGSQELTALDRRFWVMYWDVFRLLGRGDLQKALPIYLEMLHYTIPPLLDVLPADAPERSALINIQFTMDGRLTAASLKNLLDAYSAARQRIVSKFHLPMEIDRSFESQIRRLVDRLAGAVSES